MIKTYMKHATNILQIADVHIGLYLQCKRQVECFISFILIVIFFYFFSPLFKYQSMQTLKYNKFNKLINNSQEHIRVYRG